MKQKEKKAYWEACEIMRLATASGLWAPPDRVFLKATIYCGGRMDDDNAIARLKWAADFLVSAGYLIGDRSSQLIWRWPIEQVVGRKQAYRVEFELESA